MENCNDQGDKLNKYNIEDYFNQLKGNNLLGKEERNTANSILQKLMKTCKTCSITKVFRTSEFHLGNGELKIGEEKIHAKLFEQNCFHDIISILVFIITVIEDDENDISDIMAEQELDLMEQYYETAWKYASLQAYRDHIVDEYKKEEKQFHQVSFTEVLGPGYFGIALNASDKIYKLLNGKKLGITLNDKMQFTPVNTICGLVIGMNSVSENCKSLFDNPCEYCLAANKACGYCSYSK